MSDAYDEGYEAAMDDEDSNDETQNPYFVNDDRYNEWERGYEDFQYEN